MVLNKPLSKGETGTVGRMSALPRLGVIKGHLRGHQADSVGLPNSA